MSSTPLKIFGVFAVVVVVVAYFAISSTGSEDSAPVPVESQDQDAKELFATNCGTCHTLEAAGTDGNYGPNLDQILSLSPTPAEGSAKEVEKANETNWTSNYGRVLSAVTCGLNGRMPKGILQGSQAQEVAGFVAAYAGQVGPDQGPLLSADERKLVEADACPGAEGGAGETDQPDEATATGGESSAG
jgi:mono/diheme cytochrome c family protein